MKNNIFEVLLVEDNIDDIELTREAVKESGLKCNLSAVSDGIEAMDFLRKKGNNKDSPKPDIILLDLNMPKKDGRQVPAEIKADSELQMIPVIILTILNAVEDIVNAYKMHADCYINKAVDLDSFTDSVRKINTFWFKTVALPGSIGV